MKYSLHITSAPYESQSAYTALNFAKALLNSKHSINRVFFSGPGVYHGNALATPPQDEINLREEWSHLSREYGFEMIVCIAGALRRGILDKDEAQRYDKDAANLASGFNISGLGQLIEAAHESDRLVTFG